MFANASFRASLAVWLLSRLTPTGIFGVLTTKLPLVLILKEEKKYKKVIGHGLNKQELEKNTIFDTYWIQNFNLNQEIPLDNKSVDCCLMVAAWQYLQYPEI